MRHTSTPWEGGSGALTWQRPPCARHWPTRHGHAISHTSPHLRDATPDDALCLWRRAGLRGRRVRQCPCTLVCGLGLLPAWGPQEAAAEEIETRAAKHLALQHLEVVDVPLDGTRAPGESDARFDRFVVLIQSFCKALQGLQRTGGRALQPGIKLRRLPLADP